MKKLVIGITGGIGCGISEVTRRLSDLGAEIVNVDAIGRKVVENNEKVQSQLKEAFDQQYFQKDGSLDRKKLGDFVFSDENARKKLDQIVHPLMIAQTKAEIEKLLKSTDTTLVAVDAALIFELGLDEDVNYIVVVDAPLELRKKRIKERDGLSSKEVNNRIQSQMPLEEKKEKADYIITNSGSLIDLDKKVRSLYRWLKVRARVDAAKDK